MFLLVGVKPKFYILIRVGKLLAGASSIVLSKLETLVINVMVDIVKVRMF